MSKKLQIGANIFNYPDQGENPTWGEDATAWAEAVTDSLTTVQGPNDILATTATLSNNQSSAANIPGLVFNTAQVRYADIEFHVRRVYDSGSTTVTESGRITCDYNGTTFSVAAESVGDAGFYFSALDSGQLQYTSSDLANHISTTITFKAKTIDTP
jgi:hypothetical protein